MLDGEVINGVSLRCSVQPSLLVRNRLSAAQLLCTSAWSKPAFFTDIHIFTSQLSQKNGLQ